MNRLVSVGPYNVFNARHRSDSSAAAGITDQIPEQVFSRFCAMPQVSDVWHEAPQEVSLATVAIKPLKPATNFLSTLHFDIR